MPENLIGLTFGDYHGYQSNPPKGDGHRNGQVRDRSQTYNPQNEHWVKRDTDNGRFIDQKADNKPFKGVRKED